jgi:hypothetical protein
MLANWLRRCGSEVPDELVDRLAAEVDEMRAGAFALARD